MMPRHTDPIRRWTVDGVECGTWTGWLGALNGYIKLPPGISQEELPNPLRDWAYHDEDGWIGFDTCHSWDVWSIEDRRRFMRYDELPEEEQTALDLVLKLTDRHQQRQDGNLVLWTEEKLEETVTAFARVMVIYRDGRAGWSPETPRLQQGSGHVHEASSWDRLTPICAAWRPGTRTTRFVADPVTCPRCLTLLAHRR